MTDLQDKKLKATWAYGLVSIICPFFFVAAVLFYQKAAHSEFWHTLNVDNDTDHSAAAMMAFGEFVQLMCWLGVGSFIGTLLSLKSIRMQRRVAGIGLAGLALKALPLLAVLLLWMRASLRGL